MPAPEPPVRSLTSRLSVRAVLLMSTAGYGLMALWFPLRPNVAVSPPADIRTFAPTLLAGIAYMALVVAQFALLIIAFRRAEHEGVGARPLLFILAGGLLLALPLLWAYPVNATDIFGYVIRGRIAGVYGESPFLVPAATFVGDPFMPLVGEWAGLTTPYGPLWELPAAGLMAISGDNLLLSVLLFKGLALVAFLATTTLIWSLLPVGTGRAAYTLLWAWNPGLLLTFILDGHNDAVMIFWLVLGFWVARRGRPTVGFLVMILAVLTKPVAVLALPFFFIREWRDLPNNRARAHFTGAAVVGSALLTWLAFLPWAGEGETLRAPLELALRLVREATGGAGFSPAVWVYMVLGRRISIETIGAVTQALFAGFALWLVWLGFRGRSALRGAADIFFGYLAGALNFRIWYAAWPFPWLLLDAGSASGNDAERTAYRLRAGLWFLLLAQLSVVIYGHIRVFALGGDQALAHLLGVPIVFGLPWLLALLPPHLSRPVHDA
ncbi:MAG TPA: hypothetical protein PLD89_03995 [Promineifilum sp.]|nr:hypothetical protein [Promineifilum sp.]